LVAHTPLQLEIVPLHSVNTENQEKIFSQARKTAIATTNRHPQNIISTLVIRLHAKTELKGVTATVKKKRKCSNKSKRTRPTIQWYNSGKNILENSPEKLAAAPTAN
jgi:hypothetical protein